jgi:hypothetical protein
MPLSASRTFAQKNAADRLCPASRTFAQKNAADRLENFCPALRTFAQEMPLTASRTFAQPGELLPEKMRFLFVLILIFSKIT